ncbi:MAG: putative bifunctional diguanylate cyclase/phosphodiesterase [Acidimicrobiia bacterium]
MALVTPEGTAAQRGTVTRRSGADPSPGDPRRAVRRIVARTQALLSYVDEVVTVSDAEGRLVYASPATEALLGYRPDELVRLGSVLALVHADDTARVHSAYQQAAADAGTTVATAFRALHRNRATTLQLEAGVTSLLHDPGVEGVIVTLRDVTERRRSERTLAHHALHDPLTGLPNRTLLLDRMRQALARAEDGREDVVALFVDLDRFKVVNDSLGHAAGDELLVEVARRLANEVAAGDTVARIGGDEFVVLCMIPRDRAVLVDLAARLRSGLADLPDKILRAVAAPIRLPEAEVTITASMGVAVADTSTMPSPEDILGDADAAMYLAKQKGRAGFEVFDPAVHERTGGRLTTEHALRNALDQHELRLVFQPAFDLHTRRVVGVEALVRWKHPQRGLIDPAEFLPLAEETGLILPLGAWVLTEACALAARWTGRTGHERRMWVNLSAQQVADPDLLGTVKRVLERTGLSPDQLGLELTETTLMHEAEPAIALLQALRELGVALALDDFGTGYSSLTYLHRFPVDVLKVDRSFVLNLGRDRRTSTIVNGVTAMAHALGMVVVAEGVEASDQLATLRTLGCDVAQGNFLALPMPAPQLDELLAATEPATTR